MLLNSAASRVNFSSMKLIMTDITKTYKLLIHQSIKQFNLASVHIKVLRKEMNELASTLPEYNIGMNIYSVGETYGSQLIAELGAISHFTPREAITAFTGVDPDVDESVQRKSNCTSKMERPPSKDLVSNNDLLYLDQACK